MASALQQCIGIPAVAGLLAAWRGCKSSSGQRTGRSPVRCHEQQHVLPSLVDGKDYLVFRRAANGQVIRSTLSALLEDASKPVNRCVLLGEVHDDAVAHKLQEHIVDHCSRQEGPFTLSLEMFETDVQCPLDEYVLKRSIREQDMLLDCRPWGNYYQDYRPLVELCRERGVRVIAANAPRRYVSMVAREGQEALSRLANDDEAKRLLPPLPLAPPSWQYREKFLRLMSSGLSHHANKEPDSSVECPFIGFQSGDASHDMMVAQNLWDHTMAFNLAKILSSGSKVLHVCGAFHCANGLGIPEALPRYMPNPAGCTDVETPLEGSAFCRSASMKSSPNGSCIIVVWPASVGKTLEMEPRWPSSISAMADWTILTDEHHDQPVAATE